MPLVVHANRGDNSNGEEIIRIIPAPAPNACAAPERLSPFLPSFRSQSLSCAQLLAAMSFWIIGRQALFKAGAGIFNRRDQNLIAIDR